MTDDNKFNDDNIDLDEDFIGNLGVGVKNISKRALNRAAQMIPGSTGQKATGRIEVMDLARSLKREWNRYRGSQGVPVTADALTNFVHDVYGVPKKAAKITIHHALRMPLTPEHPSTPPVVAPVSTTAPATQAPANDNQSTPASSSSAPAFQSRRGVATPVNTKPTPAHPSTPPATQAPPSVNQSTPVSSSSAPVTKKSPPQNPVDKIWADRVAAGLATDPTRKTKKPSSTAKRKAPATKNSPQQNPADKIWADRVAAGQATDPTRKTKKPSTTINRKVPATKKSPPQNPADKIWADRVAAGQATDPTRKTESFEPVDFYMKRSFMEAVEERFGGRNLSEMDAHTELSASQIDTVMVQLARQLSRNKVRKDNLTHYTHDDHHDQHNRYHGVDHHSNDNAHTNPRRDALRYREMIAHNHALPSRAVDRILDRIGTNTDPRTLFDATATLDEETVRKLAAAMIDVMLRGGPV